MTEETPQHLQDAMSAFDLEINNLMLASSQHDVDLAMQCRDKLRKRHWRVLCEREKEQRANKRLKEEFSP